MKRIIVVVITVMLNMFILTSCDVNNEHTHQEGDWVVLKDATCTTSGTKKKYCSTCNEELLEEAIPVIECNYVDNKCVMCGKEQVHAHQEGDWIVLKDATCTEEGKRQKKCNSCGEILKEETIKKLQHIYETTTVDATCTEAGLETKVCKLCNDKQEKVLEKLEHIYETTTVDPTCTEAGLETKVCKLCNDKQ